MTQSSPQYSDASRIPGRDQLLHEAVELGLQQFRAAIQAYHQADPGRAQKTTNEYVQMALTSALAEAVTLAMNAAEHMAPVWPPAEAAVQVAAPATPAPVARTQSPPRLVLSPQASALHALRDLADDFLRLRAAFIDMQPDVAKTHQSIYNYQMVLLVKVRVGLMEMTKQSTDEQVRLALRVQRDMDSVTSQLLKSAYAIAPASQTRFNDATTELMILGGRVREAVSSTVRVEETDEPEVAAPAYRFG